MLTTEIAELTKKQHGHVMRDTKKMLTELHGKDVSRFGYISKDRYGRDQPCFRLPKRETMVLVTGYSIPLRAAVIDRLSTFEKDGERWVAMRPIVEGMGVSWQAQNAKLNAPGDRFGVRNDIVRRDASGRSQQMSCIPLRRYPRAPASDGR